MEKGEGCSARKHQPRVRRGYEDRRISSSHGIKGRGSRNKLKNRLLQPDSHFRNVSELNMVVTEYGGTPLDPNTGEVEAGGSRIGRESGLLSKFEVTFWMPSQTCENRGWGGGRKAEKVVSHYSVKDSIAGLTGQETRHTRIVSKTREVRPRLGGKGKPLLLKVRAAGAECKETGGGAALVHETPERSFILRWLRVIPSLIVFLLAEQGTVSSPVVLPMCSSVTHIIKSMYFKTFAE